jgi:hypothetical protein
MEERMRARHFIPVAGLLFICSGALPASSSGEKALWIEVKDKADHRTTIAMTEPIARQLLESDETKVHFAKKGKKDLITRDMLKSVLDGREESVEARDEDGSEAKLYMADLKVPGHRGGNGKLVFETYKSGSRTFRIALPEIELEASDEENGGTGRIETSIGWKALLPFLAKEGGAIYLNTEKDDTEVWLYVE